LSHPHEQGDDAKAQAASFVVASRLDEDAAARQLLHDVVGQSDELDAGPVNVELVVIERVHPPIVAVSGTGTGTGTKGP